MYRGGWRGISEFSGGVSRSVTIQTGMANVPWAEVLSFIRILFAFRINLNDIALSCHRNARQDECRGSCHWGQD